MATFLAHSPYIDSCLNVAKCNLGKVNLEAMLVSCFPSYSRGGPMPLAGAPRDLYMQLLACSSSQRVVAIACYLSASLCFGFYSTAATSLQCLPCSVPKVAIVERFNCISVYSKMLWLRGCILTDRCSMHLYVVPPFCRVYIMEHQIF